MEQDKRDILIRAYSRLTALKSNLPKNGWGIDEKFIREYHAVLDKLEEATGLRLEEFRIPDSELQRAVASYAPADPYSGGEEETTYTDERYCSRDYTLSKLDAILMYFRLISSANGKTAMGFQSPEE